MPLDDQQIQNLYDQILNPPAPVLPQLPRQSADDGTRPGWLGLLGEALGGGQSPTYRLRGQQEDAAGSRALLNFGINMLMASGPQRVRPDLGSIFGAGLQGAQQSLDLSQRQAAAVAQQDYQQRMELAKLGVEQGRDRTERLKNAITLLQLQGRMQPLPGDTSATTGTTPGASTYAGFVSGLEGSGKDPRSSAIGGIIDSTWQSFVSAHPNLFTGMTPQQALAARSNPALVAQANDWYAQQNAPVLSAAGITPSGQTLGIAHRLGPGAATKVLQAPDTDLVTKYLSPQAVEANPALAGVTVGQLKRTYAAAPNPSFLGATTATGGTPTPPPYQVATTGATPPPPAQTPPAATAAGATPAPAPTPQNPVPNAEPSPGEMGLPPGVPTWKKFLDLNPITFTPEQQAGWNTDLSPEVEARLQKARDKLDLDEKIARERERRGEQGAGDAVNKAVENQAKHALEEEKLRKEARDKGNEARRSDIDKATDRLRDMYKELVSGAETRLTNKEAVINRANETGLTDAQKEMKQARDVGAQLQGFSDMSEGIAQPGWLQTTRNPFGNGETIAEKLQQMGVKVDETGGAQLLRGGMVNLTRTLREGMPMGALSDRDLTFIERMGPTEWMDKDTRMAAIGYLKQAFAAKQKFASEIHKQMSKEANYSDAFDAADAKVGKDFVPRVPEDISQHWEDRSPEWTKARNKWIRDNAPPGTFYHLWDGSIMVQRR